MFLALRDLRYARGRFLLMGTVVALISVLTVVVTCLSSGLVTAGAAGLRAMPVTHFAFQRGVQGDLFSRSVVPVSAAAAWRGRPGIRDATAYGNQLTHARDARTGKDLDIALFGMEPGSYIAPRPEHGRALGTVPDGVLVTTRLLAAGVRPGDTLVDHSGVRLPVIGSTGDTAFGHVPVVYAPLRTWQRVHYGLPGTPPKQVYEQATAIALDATRTPAGVAGLRVLTKAASYGASPGYAAETGTMALIRFFLYAISMFVVGAFFVVWTVQRTPEIAVVRALGAGRGYVLKDALAQVLIVLTASTAVGSAVGVGLSRLLTASAVPVELEPRAIVTSAVLLVVLGVLGTFVAVRRITSVDPLLALGGSR